MSLTQPSLTPPSYWNCASCGRDFLVAIPENLAYGVSRVGETLVKHCPFCGKPSLRFYGAYGGVPFWL
jgi:hypothetical protein